MGYARANNLIGQLVDLDVLAQTRHGQAYDRRFHAPAVVEVLLQP